MYWTVLAEAAEFGWKVYNVVKRAEKVKNIVDYLSSDVSHRYRKNVDLHELDAFAFGGFVSLSFIHTLHRAQANNIQVNFYMDDNEANFCSLVVMRIAALPTSLPYVQFESAIASIIAESATLCLSSHDTSVIKGLAVGTTPELSLSAIWADAIPNSFGPFGYAVDNKGVLSPPDVDATLQPLTSRLHAIDAVFNPAGKKSLIVDDLAMRILGVIATFMSPEAVVFTASIRQSLTNATQSQSFFASVLGIMLNPKTGAQVVIGTSPASQFGLIFNPFAAPVTPTFRRKAVQSQPLSLKLNTKSGPSDGEIAAERRATETYTTLGHASVNRIARELEAKAKEAEKKLRPLEIERPTKSVKLTPQEEKDQAMTQSIIDEHQANVNSLMSTLAPQFQEALIHAYEQLQSQDAAEATKRERSRFTNDQSKNRRVGVFDPADLPAPQPSSFIDEQT